MRVKYAIIDKETKTFKRVPESSRHLFETRPEAESWRDFLTDVEIGDFSIVRVKIP